MPDHGRAMTDRPISSDASCGSKGAASLDNGLALLVKDREDDDTSASADGELQSLATDDGRNRSFTSTTDADAASCDSAAL